MTALLSQFFTENIWILVRKKNLDRKSCQMTACFRVFSMKRSDAKENREKTCEMTALFSWVFHRIDMNYDAKTIFWMTVFLLSRSYSTKLSDASKKKEEKTCQMTAFLAYVFFFETIRCKRRSWKEIWSNGRIIFVFFSLNRSDHWWENSSIDNSMSNKEFSWFQSYLPSDFDIYFWSKLTEDLNSNCTSNQQHGMSSNISKLLPPTPKWKGGLYFDYSLDDPWKNI